MQARGASNSGIPERATSRLRRQRGLQAQENLGRSPRPTGASLPARGNTPPSRNVISTATAPSQPVPPITESAPEPVMVSALACDGSLAVRSRRRPEQPHDRQAETTPADPEAGS